MQLISPAFEHNQQLPAKYTCKGEGINPPLQFVDIPNDTKSFVLIVDDPDAVGGLFVHWVVFNIPSQSGEIAENSMPSGVEGKTGIGNPGYFNPCPPSGTGVHRYRFKLFALDTLLDLPADSDTQAVETAMQGHILAQAELIGLFGSA